MFHATVICHASFLDIFSVPFLKKIRLLLLAGFWGLVFFLTNLDYF